MRQNLILTMLLAVLAWSLAGCSSDTTAPSDNLPPLEKSDVAAQSGFLAVAMVDIAPLGLAYSEAKTQKVGDYTYTFAPGDPVQGTVNLQFRLGGPDGEPVSYDEADWARAFTAAGEPVTVELVEGGVPWQLSFNLLSDIDRENDTATVNGGGTLVVGNYTATWTVDGLVVFSDDTTTWPAQGTLTFTNSGITAVVTFDGDHTATVEVDGEVYTLDLNTGELTEVGK
jgi:hypothetical protein